MITNVKDNSLNSRCKAQAILRNVTLEDDTTITLQHLFNTLGPRYKDHNGEYTRIWKLATPHDDNTKMAILQLV